MMLKSGVLNTKQWNVRPVHFSICLVDWPILDDQRKKNSDVSQGNKRWFIKLENEIVVMFLFNSIASKTLGYFIWDVKIKLLAFYHFDAYDPSTILRISQCSISNIHKICEALVAYSMSLRFRSLTQRWNCKMGDLKHNNFNWPTD